MARPTPTVTTDALLLAASAAVDPRTAARFLKGERIRGGLVTERLARAARELGIAST